MRVLVTLVPVSGGEGWDLFLPDTLSGDDARDLICQAVQELAPQGREDGQAKELILERTGQRIEGEEGVDALFLRNGDRILLK